MWNVGLIVLGACTLLIVSISVIGICILIVASFVKAAKDMFKK